MTRYGKHGSSKGRARSVARKLAMQALYQWQISGQEPADIHDQFVQIEEHAKADAAYFRELLIDLSLQQSKLDALIARHIDRSLEHLDPVEHAVLYIGLYELCNRPDVPFRVVINEAVQIVKRFGAEDGHKYVNAVLDSASRELRVEERDAARGASS